MGHIWVKVTSCYLIPWDHLPSPVCLSRPLGPSSGEKMSEQRLELCGGFLITAWVTRGLLRDISF